MRMFRRRHRKDRPSPDIILSPEGVPLTLRIAGIGVRLTAQITDVLITLTGAGCILVLLALLNLTEPNTLFAIGAMLFFQISSVST